MTQKQVGAICIAICAGYMVVGFWPFDFMPQNCLELSPDGNGIQVRPYSIAYSEGPVQWTGSDAPSAKPDSVSIELWLESDSEPTGNISSILSIYDGRLPENFLIGQWKSELLVRAFACNAQGQVRRREVGVGQALEQGIQRFIAITSGPGGTAFYVDGAPAKIYPKIMLRSDFLQGRLILGSTPQGGHSWTGTLYGLAVFSVPLEVSDLLRHDRLWTGHHLGELSSDPGLRALYLFDEGKGKLVRDYSPAKAALVIPEFYHVLRKSILAQDFATSASHIDDIVINVLGFVPFGFFFLIYMNKAHPGRRLTNAALTVLVSAVISTAIELAQVLLPTRSSSLTDLACNTAGGLLGAMIAMCLPRDRFVTPRGSTTQVR